MPLDAFFIQLSQRIRFRINQSNTLPYMFVQKSDMIANLQTVLYLWNCLGYITSVSKVGTFKRKLDED